MDLEDLRNFWAKALGIRGPQWMIIMAAQTLDRAEGVPLEAVAAMMRVDVSFVRAQSRLLEKRGFIRLNSSADGRHVASLSLTEKAYKHLAKLSAKQRDA